MRAILREVGQAAAPALTLAVGLVLLDRTIAEQRRRVDELSDRLAALGAGTSWSEAQANGHGPPVSEEERREQLLEELD